MTPTRRLERLLIATRNAGKVREFSQLLQLLRVPLISLDAYTDLPEPEETGETFAENASIKASYYAIQTSEWAVADDSGLATDFLGGLPGVLSARFGGTGTSDSEKMRLLLEKLEKADVSDRKARFVSVIALADPSGSVRLRVEGVCEGVIAKAPKGTSGFGYDPIFIPEGSVRTFGEMSADEKHAISHRRKAVDQFIREMLYFTGV